MNYRSNLDHIKDMILENQIEKAIEKLNRIKDKTIWHQNLRAVCYMRSGYMEAALKILIPIVFPKNAIVADISVPVKIRLNLVEGMFLAGNIAGAKSLLDSINEQSEHKIKLVNAYKKWKESLSFWGRLSATMGLLPYDKPIKIEYPFGEP
ncbi:MAG: hypothetical protein ACIAQZ_16455 [Sedimentisphaeraceae bacterium JB056]